MVSENKWKENMEKENLNKNNKDYIKDNSLSNDSNPLLMLLSASAILAGGALAYKRGFFKNPIQNTIKYASQFGKNDLNISSSIKAFNKWANIDNAESMYKNSIFRRDWSFKGVKELVKDGNIKEAIKDTKKDINNLIDKRAIYVNNFKKGKESNNRFYYQSELISELLDINRISNQYKKYPNGGALASKSKELMAKDLAQRLGVSKEVADDQLKRLGYRNLTLGDIYSTVVDKKTGKTKLLNINADFKFDEDSTRIIEEFLNVTTTFDKVDDKTRLRYLIKTDKWKNFKIDSGLLINDTGEVADIRYAGRNTKEFIRTLANDYQIPILNFNPLRFFGADKVGYKKNNYGIIHQSTIQSVLTGVPGRKTVNQTKQFGNNPLLFVNGKVLRLEGEKAVRVSEVANNMKVDRMPKTTSSYGIRSDFNSLRKISGLNTKEYTLYGDEDGSVKSFFSKVMKKLDLGFQDRDASNTYSKIVKTKSGDKEVIINTASSGLFDINGFIENTRNSILNKLPKPYKDTRESIRINQVFGTVRKDEDIYILRHKDTTLKDVITDKRADTLSRYYRETFAGRDNIKEVGDRALHTYSVIDRLNQTLSNIGLGLGMDSIGSSKDILTNLALKRFLVVYGFYQTMQYVTMLTERGKEGREENKNIQTDVAEAFKVMDLSYHKLKDYTPITAIAKTLTDLLPGIDQVTELPGVSSLALDQTYEERKEYYKSGMTPVRKGRYWELGNTPFTGCLTPFSNIYTSNGYKKACNINIGDYVLSKSGSYHKIIATKVREADETVYKVTTKLDKCEQTSLTGNHNVLAMKLSKCKRVSNSYCKPNKCLKQCSDCKHLFYEGYKEEWIPISNIVKNEYMLMYPIPKATNDDSFIKVSTILDDKKNKVTDDGKVFRKLKQNGTLFDDSMVNELIEISKINHKYGELKPKLDEISKKYCVTVKQLRQKLDDIRKNSNDYFRGYKYILSINPHIEINYELGKIIGYYASEGGYNARNITFTFNKNEVEYKNDVIHLLNSVFGFEIEKIKVKETKNAIVITINSLIAKEIFNFFAPGKAINKDKRLSKFTMNINNREFMLGFLETFIKGDGYQRKNGSPRISIVLSCYELTKNIQHMLLRLKILSTINKKKTSKINGKVYESYGLNINGIDCYNLQKLINNKVNTNDTKIKFTHSKIGWFTDDYAVVAIQDIAARHYIGQVYDFEVEQEESFVTNGYIMHNSKIQYYKPNLYRRIKGDVMFSDSKYGSRKEYFDNAWFSSPIKHFVTDKYHYDIKHYEDRPYLVTGEEFKNVPIIGDTLASTVGNFIKPQRKMHSEYWNSTNNYQDEELKMIVDDNMQDKATVNLINGYKGVDDKMLGQQIIFFNNDDKKSNGMLDNRVVVSNFNTVNYNPNDYVSIDFMPKEKPIPVVYKTSSGINGLYQASSTQDLINLRKNINTITPDKATGVNRLSLTDEEKELNIDTSYLPNDIKTTLAAQYTNLTNLTGMTGYITETLTGTPMDNANILDTSNYAYSFNKVFWDQEFGGMGGALSEIYRRFAPEKNKDFNYINPIRNTMPNLMPGDTYFTDFTKGDPYTKVKWGEGRLPGEGYERLWGIKPFDMGIGSSFIGKSKEDIIKHLLYQDEITDEGLKEILDKGTSMHNEMEKKMLASGDAEQSEQTIYDKKHNVQGTYDVMLANRNQYTGEKGIMDIKTVGDKKFKEIEATGEAKAENVSQVNFYLHNLNMNNGSILYVNRDNPDEQKVIKFDYSKELYESDMQKLEEARSDIMDGINSGEIKRGDLYSPIDRVRILADVAPYSKEYQEAVRLLKNKGMTEEKEAELKAIEERVKKQKKPLRVYDYKFSTANLDERVVKVDKVIDKGVFTVKGEDGVSYKLGGIDYTELKGVEQERALENILNKHISEGQKLTIKVDPDELKSKPSGINSTVKAIVVSRGTNLNKKLVEEGFAETKDDNSPISVNVKYSGFSKTFGKVWEKFAHMDTYLNTKFLQVRSPLEHYKRNVVYGEDFQEWERPIENFLMPVINKTIERPAGLLIAGFIGATFGRTKSAKLIGAAIGVGTIATGKAIAQTKETITGEKWKPSNRKHEEDVEEYLDKLAYVKNMKLFEEYSNKALQEDGFDVKEYQRNNEIAANSRKAKANKVERKKKELNYGKITEKQYLNSFESSRLTDEQEAELKQKKKEMNKEIKSNSRDKMIDTLFSKKTVGEKFKKFLDIKKDQRKKYKETDEYIDKSTVTRRKQNINKENNEDTQFRKITQLPENAILALQYYQKAQETVYGYDYGENVQNLMKALPKTEKDFFKYFVKAPEEEREEILQVIPNYLKEPMMNLWGKHTNTPKESLDDYFSEHQLPDEEWVGWQEDVDLNSLKVKLVNEEGLEATNFNIWQDDINKANSVNIPIPHMNKKFNKNKAKAMLERLLTESGYENVEVTPKSSLDNNIVLNIDNDTRYEVEQKLNEDYLF